MKKTTVLCKVEDNNLIFDCDYEKISRVNNVIRKVVRKTAGRNVDDHELITGLGISLERGQNVFDLRSKKPFIGTTERGGVALICDLIFRKQYYEHISNPGREGLMLAVFRAPDAERPEDLVFVDTLVRYSSLFIGTADNEELRINPEGCFLAAFSERLKRWNATGDGLWLLESHEDSVIRRVVALVEHNGGRV